MRQSEARLIEKGQPHGIAGQLNIYVPDAESYRTGYGAHNRLIVGRDAEGFHVREDDISLPESTDAQRRAAIRADWPGARLGAYSAEREGAQTFHLYAIA